MELKGKSIQELENDFWPDQKEYPTGLVERCHRYRKIKLKDLQIHQIITLLIQDIGSKYLMPIVLERMDNDISEEDGYDGSSFLESIDFFSDEIFKRNPELYKAVLDLFNRKQKEIESIVGWKRHERILRRIQDKGIIK
ncbi:MAG: hypothetical protein EOP00_20355 [Pedobacter sp.]|nr:MAG: hypothetical protein EOP00_20355 [Pedobacter sp.]